MPQNIARACRSALDDLLSDIAIYRRLVGARVRSQMQYRASFAIMTVVTFLGLGTEFVAILILFNRFDTLAGWRVGEVALLYGLASVAFGLSEMIGAGFDVFPNTIRRGEFDQVLVRPAGVFTQVLAADFQLRRIARMSQGLGALALGLIWTPVDWTLMKVAYLPVVLLSGAIMFVSLFVLGATLCFWTVQSIELINILTDGGREMTSYPMSIYSEFMQRFFIFVMPLAFVSYFPALYLLDRPEARDWPAPTPFLAPVAATLLALFARAAWGIGVRHYRGTGS